MGRKFCIAAQFIANDLKLAVENHLKSLGHEVVDLISDEERDTISFTLVAQKMAKAITSGEYELGFLFCGSGMGVSQIANKYRGVRAALVESPFAARQSRIINNSNVLCMGSTLLTPLVASQCVNEFISHEFLEDEETTTSARYIRLTDGSNLTDKIGGEF